MSRPRPSGRSYGRLTRHERNAIERMLDRNRSAREIAAELGRSPSTVTREVAAHRYVTAPRSRYGETRLSTCGNEATARCRELVPRCASCGNAGSVQAVALRLKINLQKIASKNFFRNFQFPRPMLSCCAILVVVNYRLVYGMCKSKYGFKATNCPLGRPVWGIFFGDFY